MALSEKQNKGADVDVDEAFDVDVDEALDVEVDVDELLDVEVNVDEALEVEQEKKRMEGESRPVVDPRPPTASFVSSSSYIWGKAKIKMVYYNP